MKAAVVIPIYKTRRAELKWYERISLQRCIEVFGGRYPLVFIAPEGFDCDYIPRGVKCSIETFKPQYFNNRNGYNILMINPQFYERFLDYDYMLIYQLDTFVFSDRMEEFCALGYDYIGAPWVLGNGRQKKQSLIVANKGFFTVGNGGFSLRRVRTCFEMLMKNVKLVTSMRVTEDFVFAYLGQRFPREFKVAPVLTASRFAVELLPERYCRKNYNVLPFGCHGWHRYGAEFYIRAFSECGCDLTPYAHLMKSIDLREQELTLRFMITERLRARLKNNWSMMRYVPPDEAFYVIAVNEQSGELVQRLYDEGLPIVNADNIPFLDSEDQIRAVAEVLRLIDVRGLLIGMKEDTVLVNQMIELGGLQYGRDFISYWQECLKQSTILLRRMSRPSVKRLQQFDERSSSNESRRRHSDL